MYSHISKIIPAWSLQPRAEDKSKLWTDNNLKLLYNRHNEKYLCTILL